jgi:ornithine cyclodeaminase/alanine dehydrogenase-like protein (mu-crystallin family)
MIWATIRNPEIDRSSQDQFTLVDLTGVAIRDIQTARMVGQFLRSGDQT